MTRNRPASLFAYALLILGMAGGAASAQCPIPTWSATVPPVNQLHIFCGEIDQNRVKGYHSNVYSPATDVVASTTTPANGIYYGKVNFQNGGEKFSTFFPDTCSQAQILASVIFANANPLPVQPATWRDGYSAPAGLPPAGDTTYCRGTDHLRFTVRYDRLANGRINTAFPLVP